MQYAQGDVQYFISTKTCRQWVQYAQGDVQYFISTKTCRQWMIVRAVAAHSACAVYRSHVL